MPSMMSYRCNTANNMVVMRSDGFLSPSQWTALGDACSSALIVLLWTYNGKVPRNGTGRFTVHCLRTQQTVQTFELRDFKCSDAAENSATLL